MARVLLFIALVTYFKNYYMNGHKRYEMLCFFNGCVVECTWQSSQSAYYDVKYNEENYRFCVSDHHGVYRGNLPTIISKNRKIKKIKQIAWEMHEYRKKAIP